MTEENRPQSGSRGGNEGQHGAGGHVDHQGASSWAAPPASPDAPPGLSAPQSDPRLAHETTQILPAPGPAYQATPSHPQFPPPSGYPASYGPPLSADNRQQRTRRPTSASAVVALAALTALLVGGAAGYGGARLAGLTSDSSATSAPRTSGTTAAPLPPAPPEANTVEVAKRVLPSTVMIESGSGSEESTGSGFVLDSEGRIMTNNHVIQGAADGDRITVVFSDGSRARAKILGRSPSYDLAVIKVASSESLVPIEIGDSDALRVGETVIAVGAPLALPGTVTKGIISSQDRPVVVNGSGNADTASAYINAIQTDAPINPGNSGGPLIDGAARVIGVNSAILTLGEERSASGNIGLGFAIPINQAMLIAEMLIEDGKATYPIIGANVRSAEDEAGVTLSSVATNGPADDAGLRQGDVVVSMDGEPVSSIEQLIVRIRTHRPGDVVVLGYQRGRTEGEAKVTLGAKEG